MVRWYGAAAVRCYGVTVVCWGVGAWCGAAAHRLVRVCRLIVCWRGGGDALAAMPWRRGAPLAADRNARHPDTPPEDVSRVKASTSQLWDRAMGYAPAKPPPEEEMQIAPASAHLFDQAMAAQVRPRRVGRAGAHGGYWLGATEHTISTCPAPPHPIARARSPAGDRGGTPLRPRRRRARRCQRANSSSRV